MAPRRSPLREAKGRAMPRAVDAPQFDSNGNQIVPFRKNPEEVHAGQSACGNGPARPRVQASCG
jgi:hypothetical protein